MCVPDRGGLDSVQRYLWRLHYVHTVCHVRNQTVSHYVYTVCHVRKQTVVHYV